MRVAGEVALPGGKRDAGDPDLQATALREAFEETQLQRQHVQILTAMQPLLSKHGYQVRQLHKLCCAAPCGLDRGLIVQMQLQL